MRITLIENEGVVVPDEDDIAYPCGCIWVIEKDRPMSGWYVTPCLTHKAQVLRLFRETM